MSKNPFLYPYILYPIFIPNNIVRRFFFMRITLLFIIYIYILLYVYNVVVVVPIVRSIKCICIHNIYILRTGTGNLYTLYILKALHIRPIGICIILYIACNIHFIHFTSHCTSVDRD